MNNRLVSKWVLLLTILGNCEGILEYTIYTILPDACYYNCRWASLVPTEDPQVHQYSDICMG
jgi:hypothetical protein